jgi:predicted cupin superfamily sugar epimerase
MYMTNQKMREMRLRGHSFVISKDSAAHFNQIKGRKMWVFFADDSRLKKVQVDGNGESIYYVVDDKKNTTGLNRVECSRMNLFFQENKINKISYLPKRGRKSLSIWTGLIGGLRKKLHYRWSWSASSRLQLLKNLKIRHFVTGFWPFTYCRDFCLRERITFDYSIIL